MAAEPISYTRLPGRGLRIAVFAVTATRGRLWLATDHLLAVDSTTASESYRRFYFRDIEAFVIRRTARRHVWNWVLLFGALVTAGPFFGFWSSSPSDALPPIGIGVAAFWLILIFINTLRGPTCQTHVRTAVQLEHLPSLSRVKVARKVLAMVRPIIDEAQGRVTEEEYAAAPWIAPDHAAVARFGPVGVSSSKTRGSAKPHTWLFALLLAAGVCACVSYTMPLKPLIAAGMLGTLVGFIFCIVALVRQAGSDLPAGIRAMPKIALALYVLDMIAGFVFTVMFSLRHAGTAVVTGLEIIGEPGFAESSLISGIVAVVLGCIGFALLPGYSRSRTVTAPAS